jgi:hypothetical protein
MLKYVANGDFSRVGVSDADGVLHTNAFIDVNMDVLVIY